MTKWRCFIHISFLLTVLLELISGPSGPSSPSSSTKLLMKSYSRHSTMVSHYAHSLVTLFRPNAEAHEAIFDLDLPHFAFISNFTMTINNKVYIAEVEKKDQVKKIYEEAHQQGKIAAHVGIRSSNSCPHVHEIRSLDQYQLVLSLRSGQLVKRLSAEVTVLEKTSIGYVHVSPLRTTCMCTNHTSEADSLPSTRIERGETCVRITFCPTLQDKSAFSSSGIMANVVVQYDVALEDITGDVHIYNGYFIHDFAPRGLPPVGKNVEFVFDVSGSTCGTKMKQTKKAMNVILGNLWASDYFNITSFSYTVCKAGGSIQATIQNVHSTTDYLGHMEDAGTDINTALLAAASVLKHSNQELGRSPSVGRIPLIIFLTDGKPTAGVTTSSVILSNIHQAPSNKVALFSLAFGNDADFPLLCCLSLENGAACHIYEDTSAALQPEGLYEAISMSLLADVHLDYLGGLTGASPWAIFPNYFGGSAVVAGQVQLGKELNIHLKAHGPRDQLLWPATVAANSSQNAFGCPEEPAPNVAHFIRCLWAYITITELLKACFQACDASTHHMLAAKVLNLSPQNFVTPLTLLVMAQPKEASGKTRKQTTTDGPGTIMPSHGLGAGTTQHLVPLVSPKKLVKPKLYLSSTTHSTKKMPSSKELRPLGQSPSTPYTLAYPKPQIPAQDSGTLAQPKFRTKPALIVLSNFGALLLLKSSTPLHQNLGTVLAMNSTQVPPLNSSILAHPQTGPMKHATLLYSKPGAPLQLKRDASSLLQPEVLIPQSTKSLSQPRPEFSTHQILKYPPHTAARVLAPKTPNNMPYPRPGILLPKTPKIPLPLKPSAPPHQPSLSLSLSTRTPTPNKPKIPLPSRPAKLRPPPPEALHTPSTVSSLTSPSSTMTISALGEFIITPFHPTLPSLLPPERLWHQHDLFFVIHIPHSEERNFFTLDEHPGNLLQLIDDPKTGLHVSRQLLRVPSRPGHKDQICTYFQGSVGIYQSCAGPVGPCKPWAYTVSITHSSISVQGKGTLLLSWDQPALLKRPLELQCDCCSMLTLYLGLYLEFLGLQHHYQNPSSLQLPHLEFYVVSGSSLSPLAHGLLGQFHADIKLVAGPMGPKLKRHQGPDVPVVLGKKLLKDSPRLLPHLASCLVKCSHVQWFLGQPYIAYVL
ncbi:LOW QUALITY PROTEIN: inter-alpha-trypsin inhibitor heavy chain H6 [Dama dama]